jgi:hypothetical protein
MVLTLQLRLVGHFPTSLGWDVLCMPTANLAFAILAVCVSSSLLYSSTKSPAAPEGPGVSVRVECRCGEGLSLSLESVVVRNVSGECEIVQVAEAEKSRCTFRCCQGDSFRLVLSGATQPVVLFGQNV